MRKRTDKALSPVKDTRRLVLCGIFLAAAVMLTSLESAMFAFLPAGIRIGLSNIAVMLAIILIDIPSAFCVTVLKSVYVLVSRGLTAGVLSFSGGLLAFICCAFLLKHTGASYILISVVSSLLHIFGQLAALGIMLQSAGVFGYAPVLGLVSAVSGILTGIVLNITLPVTERAVKKYR